MDTQPASEISIMLGEVQRLAAKVQQQKGRAASSTGSNMSVASRSVSFTTRTSSEGSSRSFMCCSHNDIMQLAAGFQRQSISPACSTADMLQYSNDVACELASMGSVSSRKSAYMQAIANAPSSSSSSSAAPLHRPPSSSSVHTPAGDTSVLPSFAALRKNWLAVSSAVDARTAEAATAAAEAAKAEAAAETAAGRISVSALRSSWLETQRQEAEAAAAAAAAAAALASATARGSPGHPHKLLVHAKSAPLATRTGMAADLPLPRPASQQQAGPTKQGHTKKRGQVAYTIGGSIILDKSKAVSDMAARLLKERGLSEATAEDNEVVPGGVDTAKSLELPSPTVAPMAWGEAAAVDLDM